MQKLDLTRRVEELKKFCEDTENGFKDNQAALEKKNAEVKQYVHSFLRHSESLFVCFRTWMWSLLLFLVVSLT